MLLGLLLLACGTGSLYLTGTVLGHGAGGSPKHDDGKPGSGTFGSTANGSGGHGTSDDHGSDDHGHRPGGPFKPPDSSPPAPRITPNPSSSPTNSTSITFGLTDSQGGVTFQCSLGGSLSPCPSSVTYNGLSDGRHTFEARAVAGSRTSPEASYSWVVDTIPPPAPRIFTGPLPRSPGVVHSTNATFTFCDDADNDGGLGCDRDDTSQATLYCSLDGAAPTPCSSPRSYGGLASGPHTFTVYALDNAGNQGPSASWSWIVDSGRPVTPVFTQTPGNPSDGPTVTFAWTDSSTDIAGYLCSIDHGPYLPCTTPDTFTVHDHGFDRFHHESEEHVFSVIAYDHSGNKSYPATYEWNVRRHRHVVRNFTISGDATQLLSPGAPPAPIDLVFSNPNSHGLSITILTISIKSVSAPNATSLHPCHTTDYAVGQYTGSYPLAIPAGSSTLQANGVAQAAWPTVRMLETHLNQDGCIGATVTLSYSASATG